MNTIARVPVPSWRWKNMVRVWTKFVGTISFVCIVLGTMAYAQPPPADFMLKATAGGVAPWSQAETITIDSQGRATYTRYNTGGFDPVLAESTFTVSLSSVQQLWKVIQDSNFFSLPSPPRDSTVFDGSFVKITVCQRHRTPGSD